MLRDNMGQNSSSTSIGRTVEATFSNNVNWINKWTLWNVFHWPKISWSSWFWYYSFCISLIVITWAKNFLLQSVTQICPKSPLLELNLMCYTVSHLLLKVQKKISFVYLQRINIDFKSQSNSNKNSYLYHNSTNV